MSKLWALLGAIFAHRIALHLNPVGIMHQPVEDAIGRRWIADLLEPRQSLDLI